MQKAVIFGCDEWGRNAYFDLRNKYDIVAFTDADSSLWGQKRGTHDILSPDKLAPLLGEDGIVIVCHYQFEKIIQTLESIGLRCATYTLFGPTNKFAVIPYSSKNGHDLTEVNKPQFENAALIPKNLFLNLSWKCNLRCRYCFSFGEYPMNLERENLSWDVVYALTAQLKEIKTLEFLDISGFGEPLMNPDWFEMLSHILNETTIHYVNLTTNAMTLTKENTDKLANLPCSHLEFRVSIDGTSPEDLEYWRVNTRYETIKRNVEYAYERLDKNKTTILLLNSIVLPPEYLSGKKTMGEAFAYFNNAGEWLRNDFPQLADRTNHRGVYGHFGEAFENTAFVEFNDTRLAHCCHMSFNVLPIGPTGDILACGCSWYVDVLGNVLRDNLLEVWLNSDVLNKKREAFRAGKPICRGCILSQGARHQLVANLPKSLHGLPKEKFVSARLKGGQIMFGYADEFVMDQINSTKDFFEAEILANWFKAGENPVIYDIGANIGNHTVYFASHRPGAEIYAFEPLPINYRMFEANVDANDFSDCKIHLIKKAVGNETGHAYMKGAESFPKNNGAMMILPGEEGEKVEVVVIDELRLPIPEYIKMDVEGYEVNALKGMKKTLEQCNGVVWIEIFAGNEKDVFEIMDSCGFEIVDFCISTWPNQDFLFAKKNKGHFPKSHLISKLVATNHQYCLLLTNYMQMEHDMRLMKNNSCTESEAAQPGDDRQ